MWYALTNEALAFLLLTTYLYKNSCDKKQQINK